jgi:hypothetical protein
VREREARGRVHERPRGELEELARPGARAGKVVGLGRGEEGQDLRVGQVGEEEADVALEVLGEGGEAPAYPPPACSPPPAGAAPRPVSRPPPPSPPSSSSSPSSSPSPPPSPDCASATRSTLVAPMQNRDLLLLTDSLRLLNLSLRMLRALKT